MIPHKHNGGFIIYFGPCWCLSSALLDVGFRAISFCHFVRTFAKKPLRKGSAGQNIFPTGWSIEIATVNQKKCFFSINATVNYFSEKRHSTNPKWFN